METKNQPQKLPATKITGAALVPDFTKIQEREPRRKFWIGALPSCPINGVHIGDVTFHVMVEVVTLTEDNQTIRAPAMGVVVELTKEQVNRVINTLPRMVIRFTAPRGEPSRGNEEPTSPYTENLGDKPNPHRKGSVVIIPSEKQVEEERERGRHRPYSRHPFDEPAADHLYMVPAEGRGHTLPPPISKTGLEVF